MQVGVTHKEWGTFHGKLAVLVVTKCNFNSFYVDTLRAYAISVKLRPSIPTDKTPRVLAYAPELVHGSLSTDQKKSEWETAKTVGFSRNGETMQVTARISDKTIVTEVKGGMTGVHSNILLWTAEESPISPKGVCTIPSILQVAFIVEYEPRKPFNVDYIFEGRRSLAAGNKNRRIKRQSYTFDPSKPSVSQGMTPFGPEFEKNLLKLHELTAVSGPS